MTARRVLVIDDERGAAEAIRNLLSDDGLACEVGESGEQAAKRAEDREIGAVVLALARRADLEVLRALRERRPALRVIALGAASVQELILEALRRGASDYLAKPIHEEELRLAVRRALEATETATRFESLCARLGGLADDLAGWPSARMAGEPAEVADAVVETASLLLGAARTSLLVADGSDRLRVAAIRGGDHVPTDLGSMPIGESVAGLALAADQGMLIDDVDRDERCAGVPRRGRYASRSALLVPLRGAEGPLGVLCATERPSAQPFAEEDLALARLLALAAAPHFGATAPAEETPAEAGSREEIALAADAAAADPDDALRVELARGIASALTAEIEPGPLLRAALRPLAELLEADPVSLYLVDARAGALALEASIDSLRPDRPQLPRDRGLAGEVLRGARSVASEQPESEPGFAAEVDTPEDGVAGRLYCVPIAIRGRVLGIARAFPRGDRPPSLRTAELLSSSLSAAVRNALLYRSLLESIDDLARARREGNGRRA